MTKSADRRRGGTRHGFLTMATVGSMCVSMLATSLTGKEILFQARCANTELANQVRPVEAAPPNESPEQVAEVAAELQRSLAKR